MKKFLKILSLLVLSMSISCYTPYPKAPSISYENLSNNFIRELTIEWNERRIPGAYEKDPGVGGSSSFQVRQKSDFYGPVHISWKNAKGKVIAKDFVFKEEYLSGWNFDNARINLYITQDDLLMFVRENYKTKSEDEKALGKPFMGKYSDYHAKTCPNLHKLGSPPCQLPIQVDPEWEKVSKYYVSKYGVESYSK